MKAGGLIPSWWHLGQRLGLEYRLRSEKTNLHLLQTGGLMISLIGAWRLLPTCSMWAMTSLSEIRIVLERSRAVIGNFSISTMMRWRIVIQSLLTPRRPHRPCSHHRPSACLHPRIPDRVFQRSDHRDHMPGVEASKDRIFERRP